MVWIQKFFRVRMHAAGQQNRSRFGIEHVVKRLERQVVRFAARAIARLMDKPQHRAITKFHIEVFARLFDEMESLQLAASVRFRLLLRERKRDM